MLYEWIRDYVKKYSFVKTTIFKNAVFYIYYKKDNKIKYKKLPYRATKKQLEFCIERIKQDINYYEEKKERDKKVLELTKLKPEGFLVSRWD